MISRNPMEATRPALSSCKANIKLQFDMVVKMPIETMIKIYVLSKLYLKSFDVTFLTVNNKIIDTIKRTTP